MSASSRPSASPVLTIDAEDLLGAGSVSGLGAASANRCWVTVVEEIPRPSTVSFSRVTERRVSLDRAAGMVRAAKIRLRDFMVWKVVRVRAW